MKLSKKLEEISDGNLYNTQDIVTIDTKGCRGCSSCCYGVSSDIALNPYDWFRLAKGLNTNFKTLLGEKIELTLEENIRLPFLKMNQDTKGCIFLDQQERCQIHGFRPSICRLFPLKRVYDQDTYYYIFQPGECVKEQVFPIIIKDWIQIEDYEAHKEMLLTWHQFLKAVKWRMKFVYEAVALEEMRTYIINSFYAIDWSRFDDFYPVFYDKIKEAKIHLAIL